MFGAHVLELAHADAVFAGAGAAHVERALYQAAIVFEYAPHHVVGDGNFHSTVFVDPDDDDMMARVLEYDRRLVQRALDMGGTCTGEHGIGMGKLKHMRTAHGDGAVEVMQAIKRALDPQDIMNPGKVVDC